MSIFRPATIGRVARTITIGAATAVAVFTGSTMHAPVAHAATPPNIVVFMVDDLAEMDLRVWNRLPNIKSLFVDQGVRFSQYFGENPLCCPGRANVFTGQKTIHNGVYRNYAPLLDARETIATELHGQGYYTGYVGKYLNGTDSLTDKSPNGYDYAAITAGGYYRYNYYVNDRATYHGTLAADYSTRVFINSGNDFLGRAPQTQPIFAFFMPYATHEGANELGAVDPHQPVVEPKYKGDTRCTNIAHWFPPNYNETDVSDKPAFVRKRLRLGEDGLSSSYLSGWPLTKDCRSLLSLDEWVGQVKSTLVAQGRYNNTIFILTDDNGMGFGAHRWPAKRVPYAEQMPLFVTWPAGRGTAPATSSRLVENIDLAPTLCEVAGCAMGPYPNGTSVDGQSFLGYIAPQRSSSAPVRSEIYTEYRDNTVTTVPLWRGLRTDYTNAAYNDSNHPGRLWHYVEYGSGFKELYDVTNGPCWTSTLLAGDSCEMNNLAYITGYSSVMLTLANEVAGEARGIVSTVPRMSFE